MADIPFEFIIFLYLGSFKAALLSLNNLFLAFPFTGFIHLIPYLFINKVAVFQPPYSAIFFMEDLRLNYIISSLRFAALSYNFTFLPGFFFIYGPTPSHRLIFKIIWFFNFIFYHFYYIFVYFLSLMSAFVLYFLP